MTGDPVLDAGDEVNLAQVVAAMWAAGWRGEDDERLLRAARRKLATARYHQRRAAEYRSHLRAGFERHPEVTRWYMERALCHDIRVATLDGRLTRAHRDLCLRLAAAGWSGSMAELILVTRAILEEPARFDAAPSEVEPADQ